MFARHHEHERTFPVAVRAFASFDDARSDLRRRLRAVRQESTELCASTLVSRCGSASNVARSLIALLRDACGRGDRARAALCAVTMLRATMGTLSGAGAREAETRDRARGAAGVSDKRSWIDREVLYCALETLISEEAMAGSSEYRVAASTRMDEARVRERVKTLSAVGSARSDADTMERAARLLVDDDDIEGAIAVLRERRKKSPKNPVRDDTKFPLAKTTALLRHLRWVRRMRAIRFSGLSDDGDRVLPLVWRPGSKHHKPVDDVEAVKLGGEAKAALQEAIRLDEGDAACAVALAQIEAFQGSFLRTREVLTKCLMKNPNDADVNAAYAELLMNAMQTRHPKGSTLDSDAFRLEVTNACKAVLRIDPTSNTSLMMLWKLLAGEKEKANVEQMRRIMLESIATCVEVQPTNKRAWVMLATMLTGIKGLGITHTDISDIRSELTSIEDDDLEVDKAAEMFACNPVDEATIQHVFDNERQWWPDTLFKKKDEKAPLKVGEIRRPSKEEIVWLRVHYIIMVVLYPGKPTEARYRQVEARLDYIESKESASKEYKAFSAQIRDTAKGRRDLYGRMLDPAKRAAETRIRRKKEKRLETAPRHVAEDAEDDDYGLSSEVIENLTYQRQRLRWQKTRLKRSTSTTPAKRQKIVGDP